MATLDVNGERRTLRLTLGALARLERALGAESVEGLAARLGAPRAADLLVIVAALIGDAALDEAALERADIDPAAAARAIAEAFAEAEGPKRDGGSPGPNGSPMACAT